MTAKEIMTQGIGFFAGKTAMRFGVNQNSKTDNSFDMVLNNQNEQKFQPKQENSTAKSTKAESVAPNTQIPQNVSQSQQSKETSTQVKETADTKDSSNIIKEAELVEEAVQELEEAITQVVKEVLDITQEELEDLLSILNVGLVDLFNPDILRQLVLEVNQSGDFTDLLLNEDMANQFNALLNVLEPAAFSEQFQISPEQLQKIIETVKLSIQEQPQITEDIPDFTEVSQPETEKPITADENLQTNQAQAAEVKPEKAQEQDGKHIAKEDQEKIEEPKIVVVKTQEEETQKDSLLSQTSSQNQNQDQKAEKRDSSIETFIENLVGKPTNNEVVFQDQAMQIQQMKEIVQQVVQQIKIIIKPEQTQMQMQLNPEHLGKLQLSITEKNGAMTASFVVQNEVAKEAIESQIQILQDRLQQQGLKVDAVEVTVSNFAFEQSNQAESNEQEQRQKQKHRNHISLDNNTLTEQEPEQLEIDRVTENGGSIDYTA